MVVGSKEWEEYVYSKRQKELEELSNKNYQIKLIEKYVFPDTTEIFDKSEAEIYDSFFKEINDLYVKFIDYIIDKKNKLSSYIEKEYLQCDKDIILDFKKKYYNILWRVFKSRYGESKYDEYFEKFINNPERDMEGAARCVYNIPYNWVNLNNFGYDILSCDNEGRKFDSFHHKCSFIDDENEI